ncbi:MAG TPA: murein L,D-transpeptidase catalytic domain family protein [Chitinophagaceae bacterium]|nr:murein L,D-transpeptidase catalytic domain family protein [Chitinophagaceae bacterium]
MKFSVPKFMALILILGLPMLIIAKKSSYAEGSKSTPLPVGAAMVINKSLTFSSLLYFNSGLADSGLQFNVLDMAMKGFSKLRARGLAGADSILTIIDFSKSSKEKRLYVVDLKNQEITYNSVVAHGRNSGQEYARSFSNKPSSNKSSLGFYVTRETYRGSNGYSLKLEGTETGINDMAMARAIVMHGADYANESVINGKGFLGRSLGCPAVPEKINKKIIDKIKEGNVLFVYYPDANYIRRSKLLNG